MKKRPKFFRYNRAHECLNKLAHQRGARKVRIKPSKPERERSSGTLLLPAQELRECLGSQQNNSVKILLFEQTVVVKNKWAPDPSRR